MREILDMSLAHSRGIEDIRSDGTNRSESSAVLKNISVY